MVSCPRRRNHAINASPTLSHGAHRPLAFWLSFIGLRYFTTRKAASSSTTHMNTRSKSAPPIASSAKAPDSSNLSFILMPQRRTTARLIWPCRTGNEKTGVLNLSIRGNLDFRSSLCPTVLLHKNTVTTISSQVTDILAVKVRMVYSEDGALEMHPLSQCKGTGLQGIQFQVLRRLSSHQFTLPASPRPRRIFGNTDCGTISVVPPTHQGFAKNASSHGQGIPNVRIIP